MSTLPTLVTTLQSSLSILHKQDIQTAASTLGQYVQTAEGNPIQLGDDCAAIPTEDGYLLFAAEGIVPQLVEHDPWFAGWCAVMVNLSDIAAMGGRPTAIVDALWSPSPSSSQPIWQGMQAAAKAYGVPIVGGHTNCHSPHFGLAAAVLGSAQHLITSFHAQPGDALVLVLNMNGEYHRDYPFWNAATQANPTDLQAQLRCLPKLAATHLVNAGKDISMGGIAGTLLMLTEASGCGAILQLDSLPRPTGVPWEKWLTSFPSFGFLLSLPPQNVPKVQQLFTPHNLTCQPIGTLTPGHKVFLNYNNQQQLLWDLTQPLTGFSPTPPSP
ncbi:MAG: sll0787 family AIR synthase-like protein [Cyanobacteria bacterium J06623_4]